jgi:hypothetical protein
MPYSNKINYLYIWTNTFYVIFPLVKKYSEWDSFTKWEFWKVPKNNSLLLHSTCYVIFDHMCAFAWFYESTFYCLLRAFKQFSSLSLVNFTSILSSHWKQEKLHERSSFLNLIAGSWENLYLSPTSYDNLRILSIYHEGIKYSSFSLQRKPLQSYG